MVAVEKLVCVRLVWCCVVMQVVTSAIEEHPNVSTCRVTWCFNPQEHSQNTDQHLKHTVTSVVCCRYCVVYYLVRSCVEVVWGWQTLSPPGARCVSVLYQQEGMPTFRSLQYSLVDKVRHMLLLDICYTVCSSWLVCGFDSGENCPHFVYEMAA